MLGDNYKLKNGFSIYDKGGVFDFYFNDNIIVSDCINFSYVSDVLIAIKKKNVITIFSIVPLNENGILTPNILAKIENSYDNIFAKVVINNICYVIDYNCQITANTVRHKLNPKIN